MLHYEARVDNIEACDLITRLPRRLSIRSPCNLEHIFSGGYSTIDLSHRRHLCYREDGDTSVIIGDLGWAIAWYDTPVISTTYDSITTQFLTYLRLS